MKGIIEPNMPIPALKDHLRLVAAGAVTLGIEYRWITDDTVAVVGLKLGADDEYDDGICLHVFETDTDLEYLRFDCFDRQPHYHYIDNRRQQNTLVWFDRAANGDPVDWALQRIRTRLPQMLAEAGATELATRIDQLAMDEAIATVTEMCLANIKEKKREINLP